MNKKIKRITYTTYEGNIWPISITTEDDEVIDIKKIQNIDEIEVGKEVEIKND